MKPRDQSVGSENHSQISVILAGYEDTSGGIDRLVDSSYIDMQSQGSSQPLNKDSLRQNSSDKSAYPVDYSEATDHNQGSSS